jgi:glycosyltransferase involved in cell wall biosynthesis
MPQLSVLISVYNSEKYIEECIKSVLAQSFKDFELIIVNDGSTDSTLDILKNFNDSRIKIFSKTNSGLIDSLNFGISLCQCELIARLDSDDVCVADRFEIQLNNFGVNDVIVGSNAFLINEKSIIYGKTNFPITNVRILESLKRLDNCIIHPSVIFKKSILLKAGGFCPEAIHAEDFDLWLRMAFYGEIKILKKPLIYLRKHSGNISRLNTRVQLISSYRSLVKYSIKKNGNLKEINRDKFDLFSNSMSFNFLVYLVLKNEKLDSFNLLHLPVKIFVRILIKLIKFILSFKLNYLL